MSLAIRPMSPDDRPMLLGILENTPEFKTFEVDVAKEVIDNYLAHGISSGYIVQVAEHNAGVVGFISYGEAPCTVGSWNIYWIAVDRSRQRRGLGKALSEAAETAIKQANGRLIFIETSSTTAYENSQRFYRARGYEVIARIPDFYTLGDDKLILQKKLQ